MTVKPILLRSWWVFVLRGVLALLFGVLALAMPGPTVMSLVLLFAAYALLAGCVYLIGAARNWRHARGEHAPDWWLLLLFGVVSIGAGVLAARRPALALLALVMVIGASALITGVLDVIMAMRLRSHGRGGDWLLLVSGLASIVFGTILVVLPGVGALALVWMIGVYAIVVGALYLVLALRSYERAPDAVAERGVPRQAPPPAPATARARSTPQAARPAMAERRVGERRMVAAGQH